MNSTLTWMGLSANQVHDPNCIVRQELDASDCRKVYQTVAKKCTPEKVGLLEWHDNANLRRR